MNSKTKNLLFITTSSLASNPRLVKEFEALKNDFVCYVLCFKHQDWSLDLSEAIKMRNPEVQFIEIDRHAEVFQTLVSKISHKIAISCNGLFSKNLKVCAFASNDKTPQLYFKTKSLRKIYNFSRVIAHNLGAFYPAFQISDSEKIALQLDIEDYYPGEAVYFNEKLEAKNRMQLMAHSFLKADDITYASQGIFLECEKHFKVNPQTEKVVIINAFNACDFEKPINQPSKKMTCVWFSQNIGSNRGLENVFDAAENIPQIEFHLIGNRNQDFLNEMTISDNIIIHDIMEQSKLHTFLKTMDIGLALEPGKDLNNTIALSNKMIAYAQAGCYILATNTFGQSQFLDSLDYDAGMIITPSLKETLKNMDLSLLDLHSKTDRWQNAKSISWENEQLKLKTLVK